MDSIKTYVFFDLESTGLSAARVTEVSLVAVHHQEFTSFSKMFSNKMASKSDQTGLCWLYPRVMNKLTLAVNPAKPVNYFVEQLTGLSNYNLEHQPRFRDGAGPAMVSFIASLAAPVCLVAHNGNRFDFPLLMKELKLASSRLGSDASLVQMPDDLLCCDSFKFFQWFYKDASKAKPVIVANSDNGVAVSNERKQDHDSKVDTPNSNSDLEKVEEPSFGTPTKSCHLDSSPFLNTPVKTPGQKEVNRVLYETPCEFSTPRSSPAKNTTDETTIHTIRLQDNTLQGIVPLNVKPGKLAGIQDLMDILVKDDDVDHTEFSDNDDDCFNDDFDDCFNDSFEDCLDSQVLLESFEDNNKQQSEHLIKTDRASLKIKTQTIVVETGAGDGEISDLNDSFNTPPSTPCKKNRIQFLTPKGITKDVPNNSDFSANKAFESPTVKPLTTKAAQKKPLRSEEEPVETNNTTFTTTIGNGQPTDESSTEPKRRKGRGPESSGKEDLVKSEVRVKPPSLSLPKLYEYLFGRPPVQSHGAEVDCLSLLQVIAAVHPDKANDTDKDTFQEWANDNCQYLKDVKSMA